MTEINGVDEVIRNMGNIQVRRLPVVNRDKRLPDGPHQACRSEL